jgi:tRNA(Ile)-lysidine synthase
MLSAVLATVAAHELLRAGDRVVVAVSGGPDSMALLHALWELRGRLNVTLDVAAIDHGLRAEAQREIDLVRDRAAALGLPFTAVAVDVAAERRARRGLSLQDAAREVRLGALAALARRHGAARVALGHQADDQAETVLYRIIRGTGVAGLAGIPYRRDVFVRPLLDVTRAQIVRYLTRRSIPFVEDPSNADGRFARARIRHRILPALAEENPRVAEALRALVAAARGEGSAVVRAGAGEVSSLSRRAAATVARLASRGGTASIDVAGGRRVEVSYGRIRVEARAVPRASRAAGTGAAPAAVVIDRPGAYRWLAAGVVDVREGAGPVRAPEDAPPAGEFDADRIAWPLVMRPRRPGDRMRPRGGRGSRKISDLMIDAKIARPLRGALPVVTGADGVVLFVPGLRPAEAGRPSATTRRFIKVCFQRAAHAENPPRTNL